MKFKKYMHLERFGHREVQGIENGTCHVFPKIDGTNASVWLEGLEVHAGSSTRHLTLEQDNAGFLVWVRQNTNLGEYLGANPKHRLYGEWLVPHTLKTYNEKAWKRFYIFDVSVEVHGNEKCVPYDEYSPELEKYGLDFIPPICTIDNPTEEWLYGCLDRCSYLIEDGKGHGEGIVVKNYAFLSPDGSQTWAKLVRQEFKEKNLKEFGHAHITLADPVEKRIVDKLLTDSMIDKVCAKIIIDVGGWTGKCIPRLLETCFYDLVSEESWSMIKEFNLPTINYRALKQHVIQKVKATKKELF